MEKKSATTENLDMKRAGKIGLNKKGQDRRTDIKRKLARH